MEGGSVTTYLALIRGINVAGHAKLAMADLRRVLESLGHTEVRTYLQSGNAVFSSGRKQPGKFGAEIEKAVSSETGLDVKVLVRTRDELQSVIEANPFPEAARTPTQLHVMFLSGRLTKKVLASLDATPYEPDQFKAGDRVLYLWLPNGLGRSKLPAYLSERRLGVTATTRNWNTATKLLVI
jgi:uncharacterized protein (DUF1697 family)